MTKKTILKRLDATITKLTTLESSQFRYNEFVTKFNTERTCGTVCCVAGWYPIWFPKVNLTYNDIGIVSITRYKHIGTILGKYHGLNANLIDVLFYGHTLFIGEDCIVFNTLNNNLQQVQQVFAAIRKLVAEDKLDNYLILN
jgi:hypothetical protein